jgi:hypothetical protein
MEMRGGYFTVLAPARIIRRVEVHDPLVSLLRSDIIDSFRINDIKVKGDNSGTIDCEKPR